MKEHLSFHRFLFNWKVEHSFKKKNSFYWHLAALQCCASFCCTAKWVRHTDTRVPSLKDFLPATRVTAEHQKQEKKSFSVHVEVMIAPYFTRVRRLVTKSRPTFATPEDRSPPGSFVCGISQARTVGCSAISFSRGSSQTCSLQSMIALCLKIDMHWKSSLSCKAGSH